MVIEAVIFDKDGVLVDSEPLKYVAMERALQSIGYFDIAGFKEWFFGRVGMSGIDSCEQCVDFFKLKNVQPHEIYDATQRIRGEMISTEPAPIITENVRVLQSLPSHIKVGVASSDFLENIQCELRQAGVIDLVHAITSGEKSAGEVNRDKPFPDIYLATARKLGVEPRSCIGVEDTDAGIRAVKAAGMYCIGYRNQNSGRQTYSGADRVTEDLQAVLNLELSR